MNGPIVLVMAGVVAAFAFFAWWQAGGKSRDLQEEINTIEGIQDAQDACPDDMPWWLRNECLRARDL